MFLFFHLQQQKIKSEHVTESSTLFSPTNNSVSNDVENIFIITTYLLIIIIVLIAILFNLSVLNEIIKLTNRKIHSITAKKL